MRLPTFVFRVVSSVSSRVFLLVVTALLSVAVSCAERSAATSGVARLRGVVVGDEALPPDTAYGVGAHDELRGVVEERRKRRLLWFLVGVAVAVGTALLVGALTDGDGGGGAVVGPEPPPIPPEEFF